MGLDRASINGEELTALAVSIIAKAKKKGLDCAIGGAVSAESLPVFRNFPAGQLDCYETRKVMFGCPKALEEGKAERGILKAVEFELLWLKNKRDFYGLIYAEDEHRIGMLEARYRKSMDILGTSSNGTARVAKAAH